MRRRISLSRSLLATAVLVASSQIAPAQEAAPKFDLAIVGTVMQTGASSFAAVPASANNLVVRVEKVLDKPKAAMLKAGDSMTMVVRDPSHFAKGTRAVFYATAWIYGQGIAAREVTHDLVPAGAAEAASENRLQQLRSQQRDQDLRARVTAADIVVVGKVSQVHPWSKPEGGIRGVSEHNPDWQEAVIQVQSAIKGAQGQNQVVVRFPKSMDIAWYLAPRFQQGQSGTFLLKKDVVSGAPKAMLAGAAVQAYTALTSVDVLSAEDAEHVRAIAAGPPGHQ